MRTASVWLRSSRKASGGKGPLLVGGAGAGPDLQPGAVGRAGAGRVEALARRRVDQRVPGRGLPLLRAGAVAVIQLHLGAVGRTGRGQVHALAESLDRAVRAHRPLLGGRAVAVVQLDRAAVGAPRRVHVDALAAVPGDLPAATAAAAGPAAGDAVEGPGELVRTLR